MSIINQEKYFEVTSNLNRALTRLQMERNKIEFTQPFCITFGAGDIERKTKYSKQSQILIDRIDEIERMAIDSAKRELEKG